MTAFRCARCKQRLTADVVEVAFGALGQPPRGSNWLTRGSFSRDPLPLGPPWIPDPANGPPYVASNGSCDMPMLHSDDFTAKRLLHPDPVRVEVGCCGMRGDRGLNLLCECGAELAAECNDCDLPNGVWLDPSAIDEID